MALLLLDRAHLSVKTEGETLALYEAGKRRGTVPVALVDRCIVHGSGTQFDSGVLQKLAEAGAVTVMFSPRQLRRFALVLGPLHNDAAVRLAQSQRVLDEPWCRSWAHAIVLAKIERQRRNLQWLMKQRADARKPLFDALRRIEPQIDALRSDGTDGGGPATSVESLRGSEGAAARSYFAGLAAVFAPQLEFSGRNRRPPRDPVNACLSLSYTLLHAQAVQACMTAGLDPLLGFYHRPAFGRESLASDLIEPLRPAVDRWVWQLFRDQVLRPDHFSKNPAACLLGKAGRSAFYASWEAKCKPWQRWLQQRARLLRRRLHAQGAALIETEYDREDESC